MFGNFKLVWGGIRRLRRGNVKDVLTLVLTSLSISRSRFKQRKIPLLISLPNVLRFCVDFWAYWEIYVFFKGWVKVHNFRVISALKWARARTQTQRKKFPSSLAQQRTNCSFSFNKHGNLYFYCIIIVYILSSIFLKKLRNSVERRKRYGRKSVQYLYSVMQILAAKTT